MNLLAGINPVTRILALILLTTPLLLSVDIVSAAVALGFTLLAAPLCGVSWGRLLRRGWPILLAAPLAAVPMALYGRPEGETYLHFLLIHVTDNSLQLAAAIFVRVLAVGLPVVVLSADVDPTDLGDGLAQVLRLPARFVLGAVAATRLVTLFRDDLDSMRRARRARGIADQGRIRHFLTLAFGLLVLSLRRGTKLATAMEARGFNRVAEHGRTWARESTLSGRDWVVMSVYLVASVAAIGIAVAVGSFRFLGVA
ncbi:MAG: energy-coupling factor transporter transmembrane protein EcfT [Corynebacterium humireducens]|jgi:energy-coupling factor transport system permease protein|uniref:Energy-coupling factor transporter transmembrane protein EcfT n=1 Tax=Corynebacterium humireducens TaxID=1223514 RepID=A0A7X6PPI3_9CORY|nr:energy-coupling factor transporter transmembrane protein EcfT [Corynebacterium humireducens]